MKHYQTSDRDMLVHLRISVARIAQAAGVSLAPIGVRDASASYAAIHQAAAQREQGWNTLAAMVIDTLTEPFAPEAQS